MSEASTCGQGLAENATLPSALGAVMSAVGDVLEAHIPSLDPADERSRRERELYQRLIEDHRRAAHDLEAIARQMVGARDLPMGRHDQAAMASPAVRQTFQRFVAREGALLNLLQRRLEPDRHMLAAMGE
jgi:hypothetical protein